LRFNLAEAVWNVAKRLVQRPSLYRAMMLFTEYLIEEKQGRDRMMSRQIQSDLGSDSYIWTITPNNCMHPPV
jgi:hypothetical protein